MATIVNTPSAPAESQSSGWGAVMAIVLVIALILLMFYYGLPALQNAGGAAGTQPAPQMQVPEQVDVNVNQPNK